MSDEASLRTELRRIDGRGYKAYKDLRGPYGLAGCTLFVDHVQGDPFAAPSRMRLYVDHELASWPADLRDGRVRRLALRDHLARRVKAAIHRGARRGGAGSGKSGLVDIDSGGQAVLERSACVVDEDGVEARIEVGLPAAGRRVLGRVAEALLCETLPEVARRALCAAPGDADEARAFVDCIENQEAVRAALDARGLVAFVGNGSVLPRESGASDQPLRGGDVVPFASPPELEVEIPVPHPEDGARWRGMGIERGVTLVVGGGYHGKSTLLRALERGVHPHVPGDGRERVVSSPHLVKIRAEDGRPISGVDIHAFIDRLPGGRDTRAFSTADASGSTSQAASIVEAVEAGAVGLLLDEDTCATNFMVRDARMQTLVHRDHEPITPFVDRVRELYDVLGVSTLLVMGGSGDYFEAADRVVAMRDYAPRDVTDDARRVAATHDAGRAREAERALRAVRPRVPRPDGFDASRGRREVRIDVRGRDEIRYGEQTIDLRGVAPIEDESQMRAIGWAVHRVGDLCADADRTLAEALDALERELDREGVDVLDPFHRPGRHPGRLARPRRHEVAAAVNRLRSLRIEPSKGDES